MLCGRVVTASSATQHCTTLSTSETMYVAIGRGTKMALSTRVVLSSFNLIFVRRATTLTLTPMYEDKQGTEDLAETPTCFGKSKHSDARLHFIRELLNNGDIAARYVGSKKQHTDIRKKSLRRERAKVRRMFLNMPSEILKAMG